jgi:aminoglycoside phosphotransferase (APT) family kinase protein
MELEELKERLGPFCRAKLGDPAAEVTSVALTPGHAGFSYFFDVRTGGAPRSFVLRVPPPGARWEGTADVLRQARVIRALKGSGVPVADVVWSGDDLEWFGTPYSVVARLEGDTLRSEEGEWVTTLTAEQLRPMAQQAVRALATIHRQEWQKLVPTDGPPISIEDDVNRWDRFWERAAEPERVALGPEVKRRLLARMPESPHIGIFHGDFQWTNLFFSPRLELLAVIDWELWGVGATLNDLGWFLTFCDAANWCHEGRVNVPWPSIDELIAMYVEAFGSEPGDVSWYRALAGYKFSIITGLNLSLHRRGKRHDPHWETIAPSAQSLMERSLELLG